MRRAPHVQALILASLASLAAAACETTGAVSTDAGPGGGDVDAGPDGHDAGPPVVGLSYTPTGCGYTVSAPMVNAAEMGSSTVSAAPSLDHLHVSFAGPSESTFAVNWRSDQGTMQSDVLYGTDQAAVAAADAASGTVMQQSGHTMLFAVSRGVGTRVHEVHVCGLAPSTHYFYKVGGAGHWSGVYDVSTAPMPGSTEPWSFAVTGDSRNDTMAVATIMKKVQEHAVDLQIFSGDAVELGTDQSGWDGFFEANADGFSVQELYARVPLMPTNGNHDGLAVPYLAQFALPQQMTDGEFAQGEEWYSFDYANAHFAVLNDTPVARVGGMQSAWLRTDLAAVDRTHTPWVFVMHHIPAYSASTNHGSDLGIRSEWQPIYDQYHVDMVFNGHDHNYERTQPIRGFQPGSTNGAVAATAAGGIPVAESGTIYLVAAGSGAPLYGNGMDYYTYMSESTRNFVIMQVHDRTLVLTAYRDDGTMLDHFEYTK